MRGTVPDNGERAATVAPRRDERRRREALTAYLFIAPCVLGFTVFYLLPALRSLQISFTDWTLLKPANWVGLANYRELLHDEEFHQAVRQTFWYVLYNIPLQTVIGLFLATALSRVAKSFAWRGLIILPYLFSGVIAALIFYWLLDPSLGFANQLAGWLHLPKGSFFGSETQALKSVAAVNIWRHMGLTALLFYAGMQSIPASTYEAARIDGASEWTMFRRITLPLLRPVLAFVIITTLLGSFQIFDTVAVITRGGPVNSTRTIVFEIWDKAFGKFRMGYASSMSVTLFVFLAIVGVIQMRVFRGGESDLA